MRQHAAPVDAAAEWLAAATPAPLAALVAAASLLDLHAALAAARDEAALLPPAPRGPAPHLPPRPGEPAPRPGPLALAALAAGLPGAIGAAPAAATAAPAAPAARLQRLFRDGCGWPVVDAADQPYFRAVRLHHAQTGAPLTQAMLDALALVPVASLPRILAGPEALRDWWLFEVALPMGLPVEALPAAHLAHWRGALPDGGEPPLPRFALALHARRGHATEARDAPARLALLFGHALHALRDPRGAALTGAQAMALLAAPLAAQGRQASVFQAMVGLAAGPRPGGFAASLDHASLLLRTELPHLLPLLPGGQPAPEPLLVAGHGNSSGLGEKLGMLLRSLERCGIGWRAFDARSGQALVRRGAALLALREQPRPWRAQPNGSPPAQPTGIFLLNPQGVAAMAVRHEMASLFERRRIGFFFTELQALPAAHVAACAAMDEIWTSSEFNRAVYAAHCATPVCNIGTAISWPSDVPDAYTGFMPERAERFVFLLSFDPASWLRRKNPSAAVAAFAAAFPDRAEPVALVIKVPTSPRTLDGDPYDEWSAIEQAAARDRRIVIREAYSGFAEYLGHVAHADCVVSPHRSEGFGYLCAQAHHFAVPLIATGYSGNLDFCNPDNAWLIEHDMRAVGEGEFLPGSRGDWADVRVAHLAALMRAVYRDPAAARARARRGQALLREKYHPARFDAALLARLAA